MARFAFLCIPGHGHINPMVALARELVDRGHSVVFLHMRDVGPMLEPLGVDFAPVGVSSHPVGSLAIATRHATQVNGVFGMRPLVRDFARVTEMLCRDAPPVLRSLAIDMIVSDQLEAAGGLIAHHMGLPFVSVAAALPMNWEPGIPSPFVGWAYGAGSCHRFRNIASVFVARKVMSPIDHVIARIADDWKLGSGNQVMDFASGFAQISQLIPGLDFPRRSLIRCFHYCGPLRSKPTTQTLLKRRVGRRRAFATLGTLQGHRAGLFEAIADAAKDCHLDLTIAHGGRLDSPCIARLGRHADVHDFVSQDDVLAASDIAIVHGGLNTVLDALAQGVPMVVIPLAFEQSAIAARVHRSRVGLACRRPLLRRRRLTALVREVCENDRYASNARRLTSEIVAAGGTRKAVDIIETVLKTGRPCLNDTLLPHQERVSDKD